MVPSTNKNYNISIAGVKILKKEMKTELKKTLSSFQRDTVISRRAPNLFRSAVNILLTKSPMYDLICQTECATDVSGVRKEFTDDLLNGWYQFIGASQWNDRY